MSDKPSSEDMARERGKKHPPARSIEDIVIFRMARFFAINERSGHRWTQNEFGLSIGEWRLLGLIYAYAPVRASDLAGVLFMDKSQLSRLIKALQARDLIRSETDRDDARATALSLTEQGEALHDQMFTHALLRNERVLEPLTHEEVRIFDRLLGKLTDHSLDLLNNPRPLKK